MEQGNTKEAIKLYTINIINYEKIGYKIGIAGTRSNIGSVYTQEGEYQKALENLTLALKGFEELGVKHGVAGISIEIGHAYLKLKNYKLAIEYTSQELILFEEMGYLEGIVDAEYGMSMIYTEIGRHNEAISLGNNELRLSRESGNILKIKDITKNLVVSYRAKGKYKETLEMNELYFQMRDSLNSEENQKAIIEIQVQADYDKQKMIDDLENEKEIAVETQRTKALRNISIAIGAVLILISLLVFVIFNRLKVTRQQKEIIEEQKKKVEQSEKYKEQFLANMSHEIRTPMHAISGMIKILKRNNHPKTQDGTLKLILKDIVHIEGDRNYSYIHLKNATKKLVTKTLSDLEELLDSKGFYRCHRSHILNSVHIINTKGISVELSNNVQLPVSRRKKKQFSEWFEEYQVSTS